MSSYLQHNSKIVGFYDILSKIINLERLVVHIGHHDRHDIIVTFYVSFTKMFIINSMFEYVRVFVRLCASGLLGVHFGVPILSAFAVENNTKSCNPPASARRATSHASSPQIPLLVKLSHDDATSTAYKALPVTSNL